MNWKLVGALLVGAGLLTACGAAQETPQSADTRKAQDESTDGTAVQATTPAMAPASTDSSAPVKKTDNVVVHE